VRKVLVYLRLRHLPYQNDEVALSDSTVICEHIDERYRSSPDPRVAFGRFISRKVKSDPVRGFVLMAVAFIFRERVVICSSCEPLGDADKNNKR